MAGGASVGHGFRHFALGAVGSTNEEALRLAAAGEAGPFWVTAERQLAGRGRRGRPWVSEPGNLYASLLLTDPAPANRLGQMPLVAAVALADAVARASGQGARLRLKWPNDLLVDDRKVSGILLESCTVAGGAGPGGATLAVVIGIGVNCLHAPDAVETPATTLAAAGMPVSVDLLFAHLVEAMATALRQWKRGQGFATIRERWLAQARGLGEPIRVRLIDRELTGRFEALDADGFLVLVAPDGSRMTIAAGDVFLLAPPAGALPATGFTGA